MSEKLHAQPEEHLANPESGKQAGDNLEKIHEHGEQASNEHQEALRNIQRSIEQHAISGQETNPAESEPKQPGQLFVNQELKSLALDRTLTRIRRRLSTPEKALSRVVHQPAIDKISQMTSQTVARPSGLLGGGVVALFGSFFLLYIAKHYGFEYNFLAFFALFIGGYFAGLLVEICLRLVRK